MDNNTKMVRMRTIPKAFDEIKKLDPDTGISMRGFRKLICSGEIPTVNVGDRVLVNLDLIIDWLYNNSTTCA